MSTKSKSKSRVYVDNINYGLNPERSRTGVDPDPEYCEPTETIRFELHVQNQKHNELLAPVANAIRRTMQDYVPIYAASGIEILNNNSNLTNEYLRQQLLGIPIRIPESTDSTIDNEYKNDQLESLAFSIAMTADQTNGIIVTTADIIPNDGRPITDYMDDQIQLFWLPGSYTLKLNFGLELGTMETHNSYYCPVHTPICLLRSNDKPSNVPDDFYFDDQKTSRSSAGTGNDYFYFEVTTIGCFDADTLMSRTMETLRNRLLQLRTAVENKNEFKYVLSFVSEDKVTIDLANESWTISALLVGAFRTMEQYEIAGDTKEHMISKRIQVELVSTTIKLTIDQVESDLIEAIDLIVNKYLPEFP